MNYLSFTSYSGWRKQVENPTYRKVETKRVLRKKRKKRQSEKLEVNLRLGIRNHPLLSCLLFSLYHVKNFSPSWSSSFVFFGCVAVKLSVCSPCGEKYREQKQHCASKNTPRCNSGTFSHTNRLRKHKGMSVQKAYTKFTFFFLFFFFLSL